MCFYFCRPSLSALVSRSRSTAAAEATVDNNAETKTDAEKKVVSGPKVGLQYR